MLAPLLSGGLGRTLLAAGVQPVQRADDSVQSPAADVDVDHRGLDAAVPQELLDVPQIGAAIEPVPQQLLDRPNVVAVHQQVRGEGVAQGMAGRRLDQSGPARREVPAPLAREMTGEILGQEILGEEDEPSGNLSPR